ncbi:sulfurtransferase, partial [Streptomyces sp. 15-116A]|nr:sulfurtransferase [Streptomyces sp. 15-116A]
MNAIISASELASELAGGNPPVLLDVRWQLSVAKAGGEPPFDGRAAYLDGHLPGAVFVDLDKELASAPGERGRHPLPDLGVFGAAMRRAGVSRGRPV